MRNLPGFGIVGDGDTVCFGVIADGMDTEYFSFANRVDRQFIGCMCFLFYPDAFAFHIFKDSFCQCDRCSAWCIELCVRGGFRSWLRHRRGIGSLS